MESSDINKEKFLSNLKRLTHREEIGRQVAKEENKGSLRKVIEASKQNFPFLDQEVEKLINEEFSIEPTRFAFAENFSKKLIDDFPNVKGLAVIPLGSVIRGGANVRKMMGRDGDGSDLDWGILYDGSLLEATATKINYFATNIIPQIAEEIGLPETKSSSYINAKNFKVPNLHTAQEAVSFIHAMDEDQADWDPWTNPLVLYLGPSIPPEYNIQNRKFLLEGLSQLSIENHALWERTVDQLADSWRQHLRLKPKHLQGTYTTSKRDVSLRKRIIDSSREVRGQEMEKFLLSTDKSTSPAKQP